VFRKTTFSLLTLAMLLTGLSAASAAPPADVAGERQNYIVVLEDGASRDSVRTVADRKSAAHNGEVGLVYEHALRGFSMTMTAAEAAALENEPDVAYVQEDRVYSISTHVVPTGITRIFADTNGNLDIDGTDDFRVDVDVAIIDTGVDFEHPDLNVVGGVNCLRGCVPGGDDDHFHGTHVAGTVGALDNDSYVVGVAPGARIWAVKVLNQRGFGSTSSVVAGIDWVTSNADTIEVANMSLGGFGFDQAEYDAIQGAVDAGVAFVVSAGNDAANASNYSPAAFDNTLTVSSLTDFDGIPGGLGSSSCWSGSDDALADYSNFGSVVGIAAPGTCILSTYPLEQGGLGTISGTSMASPHVAGALALLASGDNPNNAADVFALYSQVIGAGNFNWTDTSGDGVQEPLLDVTNFTATLIPTGGGGDIPPNVGISGPADGSSFDSGTNISFTATASDPEDGDLTGAISWSSAIDGALGSGGNISAILADGTHVVTTSVTDSFGNTSTDSISVTVGTVVSDIELSATSSIRRDRVTVSLTWSGATGARVDVYRDGTLLRATRNNGTFNDRVIGLGGASTYQVCETGSTVCSNEVTVTY